MRAAVLRTIAEAESIRRTDIPKKLAYEADKIETALAALESEGLIQSARGGRVAIVS